MTDHKSQYFRVISKSSGISTVTLMLLSTLTELARIHILVTEITTKKGNGKAN